MTASSSLLRIMTKSAMRIYEVNWDFFTIGVAVYSHRDIRSSFPRPDFFDCFIDEVKTGNKY